MWSFCHDLKMITLWNTEICVSFRWIRHQSANCRSEFSSETDFKLNSLLNSNIANKRVQSIVLEVFNSKYKLKIIVFDVINCEWKFYSNKSFQKIWLHATNSTKMDESSPPPTKKSKKQATLAEMFKRQNEKSDSRKFQIEIKRPSIDLVHRRCTPNYFPEITV